MSELPFPFSHYAFEIQDEFHTNSVPFNNADRYISDGVCCHAGQHIVTGICALSPVVSKVSFNLDL